MSTDFDPAVQTASGRVTRPPATWTLRLQVLARLALPLGLSLAATVHPGTAADTATVINTAIDAAVNLDQSDCENTINALVADKGYHSTKVVTLAAELGIRTYIPERTSASHRRWADKDSSEKQAVYANRRRTKGNRGFAVNSPSDRSPTSATREEQDEHGFEGWSA